MQLLTGVDRTRRLTRGVPGIPRSTWKSRDELARVLANERSATASSAAIGFVTAIIGTRATALHVGEYATLLVLCNLVAEVDSLQSGTPASVAVQDETLTVLRTIAETHRGSLGARLFPYILEAVETSTSPAGRWMSKRSRGVFYTPPDVAEFMVSQIIDKVSSRCPLFDPACGSGAFLAVGYRLLRDRGHPWAECIAMLTGSDLSPRALGAAVFALLLQALAGGDVSIEQLGVAYQAIASRLEVRDLRDVGNSPTLWSDVTADTSRVVVANPPYVHWTDTMTTGRNVYRTLIDLAVSNSTEAACLLLPLSVAVEQSRKARETRDILSSSGTWRLAFFDRSPDSLFGDAVKTRHLIASYRRDGAQVMTTTLTRWSSTSRGDLFASLRYTDITGVSLSSRIPKLGSPLEVQFYRSLRGDGHVLSQDLRVQGSSVMPNNAVIVADNAYNWLPVYRSLPSHGDKSNARWLISCDTQQMADALLAILTSHVAFWLWVVEGDGFHVSARWLREFPLDMRAIGDRTLILLSEVGRRYWVRALTHPKIKGNAGKQVARYGFEECVDEMSEATEILCHALGAPRLSPVLRELRLAAWNAGRHE